LNQFLETTVLVNNSSNDFLTAFVFFVASLFFLYLVKFYFLKQFEKLAAKTNTHLDDFLVQALKKIHWLFFVLIALLVLLVIIVIIKKIVQSKNNDEEEVEGQSYY